MMEKKLGTQNEQWNEVDGNASGNYLEAFLDSESDGLAILQLKRTEETVPLRGIEDQIEQNDNQLDGIINNLPEETIAEKESKCSVIDKLKASVPEQEHKAKSFCCDRELC